MIATSGTPKLAVLRDSYSYEFAGTNYKGMSAILLLEERRLDDALAAAADYVEIVHDDPLRVLAHGTKARIELMRDGLIAEKYNLLYIRGAIAVWGWYTARTFIGILVGITWWPERWWLRGPLCGLLCMLPLGLVSIATPGCGYPCMFWNQVTGWTIGAFAAGAAYALTGKQRA